MILRFLITVNMLFSGIKYKNDRSVWADPFKMFFYLFLNEP